MFFGLHPSSFGNSKHSERHMFHVPTRNFLTPPPSWFCDGIRVTHYPTLWFCSQRLSSSNLNWAIPLLELLPRTPKLASSSLHPLSEIVSDGASWHPSCHLRSEKLCILNFDSSQRSQLQATYLLSSLTTPSPTRHHVLSVVKRIRETKEDDSRNRLAPTILTRRLRRRVS